MPVGVASEVAGQAWRLRSGLPASYSFCGAVRVWLAVSRCAGDGVRGFAAAGVAGQLWGGSAIFDPLTAGFAGRAVLTNSLVGGLGTWWACASGRAILRWNGSFAGSGKGEVHSKKLDYQSGQDLQSAAGPR